MGLKAGLETVNCGRLGILFHTLGPATEKAFVSSILGCPVNNQIKTVTGAGGHRAKARSVQHQTIT